MLIQRPVSSSASQHGPSLPSGGRKWKRVFFSPPFNTLWVYVSLSSLMNFSHGISE